MAVRGSGFVAFGLSIASLVCVMLISLGGTNHSSKVISNVFAFQIDLTTFFANEPEGAYRGIIPGVTNVTVGKIPGVTASSRDFADALWQARGANVLSQFYSIYIWGYCAGDTSTVGSSADCNHGIHATFDPFTAMSLNKWTGSQSEDTVYPQALARGMHVYNKAAGWLRASLMIAAIAKIAELTLGVIAATSGWGNLLATFFSASTSLFILIISITQSAIWAAVAAAWRDSLNAIGVDAHLGKGFMVTMWLSVILSLAGSFWWLLTICCANRRSGPTTLRRKWTWAQYAAIFRGYRYDNVQDVNVEAERPGIRPPMSKRTSVASELLSSRSASGNVVGQTDETSYESYRHMAVES